ARRSAPLLRDAIGGERPFPDGKGTVARRLRRRHAIDGGRACLAGEELYGIAVRAGARFVLRSGDKPRAGSIETRMGLVGRAGAGQQPALPSAEPADLLLDEAPLDHLQGSRVDDSDRRTVLLLI